MILFLISCFSKPTVVKGFVDKIEHDVACLIQLDNEDFIAVDTILCKNLNEGDRVLINSLKISTKINKEYILEK
tara:strand:+ start:84 stop:305 length:222 start_codon:yes stop_codon:yes gene_type:complete